MHRFTDIARYWSKIAIFLYTLHSTPPLGGPRRNIAITFAVEKKTRMVCLPSGKTSFTLCLAVSIKYQRVTDGQTDGQKYSHSIVRAMHSITRKSNWLTFFRMRYTCNCILHVCRVVYQIVCFCFIIAEGIRQAENRYIWWHSNETDCSWYWKWCQCARTEHHRHRT